MAGNVWTVVIPLILVCNTNPELIVESSHTKKKVSMKYDFDNIVIFGPSTIHSTAPVHYCDDAFRVCLFLSVAHITKGNIDVLLEDVTSLFPSKNDKALLLRWSCNQPHWKFIHNVTSTNIPIVPDNKIFGDQWCKMFDILVSLKSSTDNIVVSPDDLDRVSKRLRPGAIPSSNPQSSAIQGNMWHGRGKCCGLWPPAFPARSTQF